MSTNISLRIHPAIGMARVGNSTEYYLGPETMAASEQEGTALTGGLPIKPGTNSETITSSDLRDSTGRLKRQAARFKIYQYINEGSELSYPTPGGEEVTIGSHINGKKVVDIIWTVHLANKKANCWEIDEDANLGLKLYEPHCVKVNGTPLPEEVATPPLRNPLFGPNGSPNPYDVDPADPDRLKQLVIDAGPRAIRAAQGNTPIAFDNTTEASYYDKGKQAIVNQPNYPIQFPATNGTGNGESDPINYLGEILTEENGRLLVLGGHGLACGFDNQGNYDANSQLCMDVDNDNWLDDTSDGPITAVLVLEDGTQLAVGGSAWVVVTDPAYAPQTLNAVSLWDDVYNTWLENFGLQPEIYSNGNYQPSYKPWFRDDVYPTLNAAHMQRWNANLPEQAIRSHARLKSLTEQPPDFDFMKYIRNPDGSQDEIGSPLMPLSLGDADQSLLTVSRQQNFFLQQWVDGKCVGAQPNHLGAGEQLDKTILVNCLGGRFSPGIDMTFIVRDTHLYDADWKNPNIGPFRINMEPLDYSQAQKDQPFLGVGYIPLRPDPVQPGDICKFMSIPWHTDYNSCATHTPAPNPGGELTAQNVFSGTVNTILYWSWPAQRPVAVYTYRDLAAANGVLENSFQRFSVRGEGTAAVDGMDNPDCDDSGVDDVQLCDAAPPVPPFDPAAMNVGRYQNRRNILNNWQRIGTVIQGAAIDGYPAGYDPNYYLEVQSLFDVDHSNLVEFWPNTVTDPVYPPKPEPKPNS